MEVIWKWYEDLMVMIPGLAGACTHSIAKHFCNEVMHVDTDPDCQIGWRTKSFGKREAEETVTMQVKNHIGAFHVLCWE